MHVQRRTYVCICKYAWHFLICMFRQAHIQEYKCEAYAGLRHHVRISTEGILRAWGSCTRQIQKTGHVMSQLTQIKSDNPRMIGIKRSCSQGCLNQEMIAGRGMLSLPFRCRQLWRFNMWRVWTCWFPLAEPTPRPNRSHGTMPMVPGLHSTSKKLGRIDEWMIAGVGSERCPYSEPCYGGNSSVGTQWVSKRTFVVSHCWLLSLSIIDLHPFCLATVGDTIYNQQSPVTAVFTASLSTRKGAQTPLRSGLDRFWAGEFWLPGLPGTFSRLANFSLRTCWALSIKKLGHKQRPLILFIGARRMGSAHQLLLVPHNHHAPFNGADNSQEQQQQQ